MQWQGPPRPFDLSHLGSNKLTALLQGLPVPKQLEKVAAARRGVEAGPGPEEEWEEDGSPVDMEEVWRQEEFGTESARSWYGGLGSGGGTEG